MSKIEPLNAKWDAVAAIGFLSLAVYIRLKSVTLYRKLMEGGKT